MKAQQLKKYLGQFPFLSVFWKGYTGEPIRARDVAFIAVRPWDSLDKTSRSVILIPAYRAGVVESRSIVGQISYHLISMVESPVGWTYKIDHVAFDKDSSIENMIKQEQNTAMILNRPLKLAGIVRIASAFMGVWSTPRKIEIFLCPENQP